MLDRRGENHSGVKPLSFVEIQELARAVIGIAALRQNHRLEKRNPAEAGSLSGG